MYSEFASKAAKREGYEWVFIDTPPSQSGVVTDAIRAATLVVIPARATVFDLMAVQETIELARELRTPYAVVINSAPAKRDEAESPIVAQARSGLQRFKVPVWSGQITHRSGLALSLASGEGAREFEPESLGAEEIGRALVGDRKLGEGHQRRLRKRAIDAPRRSLIPRRQPKRPRRCR